MGYNEIYTCKVCQLLPNKYLSHLNAVKPKDVSPRTPTSRTAVMESLIFNATGCLCLHIIPAYHDLPCYRWVTRMHYKIARRTKNHRNQAMTQNQRSQRMHNLPKAIILWHRCKVSSQPCTTKAPCATANAKWCCNKGISPINRWSGRNKQQAGSEL